MSGALRWQKRSLTACIILSLTILLASAGRPTMASTRAEKNQDIVFLIDTSSSMRNIFGDIKRAISEFVLQARPGDNVVLISFGEKVELRTRRKISSDEDVKLIARDLASLKANEYFTYTTGALYKGMEELQLLEEKHPDHSRTLVLMSDGRNNPPEEIAEPLTFDDILKKYSDLLQEPGSAFFYLSLGDDPDRQVLAFMEAIEGSSFDLGKRFSGLMGKKQRLAFTQIFVEPTSIDLGAIFGPKATATVSLTFLPARGDPSGNVITTAVSARFRKNPSWKTAIEATPAALSCSSKSWSRELFIRVDSTHEGTVIGTLELKPLPGQVLFIEPSEIPITMTIRQPHVKVLQEGRLEFGPIAPRGKSQETQTILLIPNSAAMGEAIQASPDIALPEGMTLATNIERRDKMLELAVTVATDESFHIEHSMTLGGGLRLSGARHAIAFSRELLEIRIKVAPLPASSRAIAGLRSWLEKLVLPGLITILALTAAMGGYWWLRLRLRSALEGKLVLLHLKRKPLDSSKVVKVNLHSIGESLGRDSLTIGSSKEASITLPHKSVAAHHCEIYARIDRGNTRIYIEPIGRNSVIVNLQKIREPIPLSDRDIVEIGAYTFRFENPPPYKQIVVKYLDGRVLKGTPTSWDIESDEFSLLPRDALPRSNEEILVAFADLKAVYFVRDFDRQIGKKRVPPASRIRGAHMRLAFHDGEEMEGYTLENYEPSSTRFYFLPSDQLGNTISLVVERQHLRKAEML
ncbi:MAG: VWA domain-containing protein [Candidatus Hydrogenedentota bacterium]|nr:MAG: VWA domain-containing protein [Candidatus Hydrogenedentota bacterium]